MGVTGLLWAAATVVWVGSLVTVIRLGSGAVSSAQRALVLSILCFAAQPLLSSGPGRAVLEDVAVGATKLLVNVAAQAALYALLAFFVLAVSPGDGWRALRKPFAPFVPALLIEVVVWGAADEQVRADPAGIANSDEPLAVAFTLAALSSMSWALAQAMPWALRLRGRTRHGVLRRALAGIVAAIAALLVASLLKILIVLAVALSLADPESTRSARVIPAVLVVFGVVTFALAASLVGVSRSLSEFRLWKAHRRGIQELDPLWRMLTTAFPEVMLDREPRSGRRYGRLVPPRRVHRRYYRRLVEIRDGLVRLAPYYDADVADAAEAEAVAGDHTRDEAVFVTQAVLVVEAVQAMTQHRRPERAHPIPNGGSTDLDADARWLQKVSLAVKANTRTTPPLAAST